MTAARSPGRPPVMTDQEIRDTLEPLIDRGLGLTRIARSCRMSPSWVALQLRRLGMTTHGQQRHAALADLRSGSHD
jgi:hypothetical protein